MKRLTEQTSTTRRARDKAKQSLDRYTADLRDMKDVANRAAGDLETRKEYRRKRAESMRARERDRKRT